MVWTPESIKQAFHLFDAPGHGSDICDGDDSHRAGSPDGFKIQDQMKEFSDRGIEFTVIKVNNRCEKMIRVMESCYNINGRKLNITCQMPAQRSQVLTLLRTSLLRQVSL